MKLFAVLVVVVLLASVARADPDATAAPAAPLVVHPNNEVSIGYFVPLGITASYGRRLVSVLWAHAQVLGISVFGDDTLGGGLGLEARPCVWRDRLCASISADAIYDSTVASPFSDTSQYLLFFARAGFDVGSRHLRFRAGFDMSIASYGRTADFNAAGYYLPAPSWSVGNSSSNGIIGFDVGIGYAW